MSKIYEVKIMTTDESNSKELLNIISELTKNGYSIVSVEDIDEKYKC
jgi:hypothetical protein